MDLMQRIDELIDNFELDPGIAAIIEKVLREHENISLADLDEIQRHRFLVWMAAGLCKKAAFELAFGAKLEVIDGGN
jgi:hypothetical protein